jgi:hypothetical protein
MMERSIVNIDLNGLSTKGKNGVCPGHWLDEDEVAFSPNIDLIDTFKPLLRDQYSLFADFCAHVGLQINCNVIVGNCIAIQGMGRAQRSPSLSYIFAPSPLMGEGWGEGEMNINLQIERLVLDGISLLPSERPLLQAAVETELMRLLASGGLNDALRSGGALYSVRAAGIQLANDGNTAQLGEQIAGAVYGGIGK